MAKDNEAEIRRLARELVYAEANTHSLREMMRAQHLTTDERAAIAEEYHMASAEEDRILKQLVTAKADFGNHW